ncbi:MAG TPA: S16 family serine protease [Actinomycetota bacterium]
MTYGMDGPETNTTQLPPAPGDEPAGAGGSDPEPPRPDEDPERPSPAFSRRSYAIVPVAVLVFALLIVKLPYFVFAPGSATDVEPLIKVSGAPTYQSEGHLLLTDVAFFQPDAFSALWGWLSPSQAVVPQSDYLAPGQGQAQFIQQGFQEMDTSKIDAAYVALRAVAGYPQERGPGLMVEAVGNGVPAEGKIRTGEVILAVNGTPVNDEATLSHLIRSAGYGATLTFRLKDGAKTRTVAVTTAHIRGVPYPAVGINTVPNFPFSIQINSSGIGGPSAGLMWTLGLIDVLTPGDLTGGEKIAGTGTIDTTGQVGAIGGVEQKVVAAERAGAKVFFVPVDNANAAKSVAGNGIAIVPVTTYRDALAYLRAHGGRY